MKWITSIVGAVRLTLVDDSKPVQQVQVTEPVRGPGFRSRATDRVMRLMEFGFTSNPPLDSEAVVLRRTGERADSIVVATSHRASRPTGLKPGDAGIYDVRGAKVMLTDQGIVIEAAGHAVTIRDASKVRVEADVLEVTGDVVSKADGTKVSLNALAEAYGKHKHVGVQAGGAVSGKTDSPL